MAMKRKVKIFVVVFCFLDMVCGILVPQPGIKPILPAVEAWSFNCWTAREVMKRKFLTQLFPACQRLIFPDRNEKEGGRKGGREREKCT